MLHTHRPDASIRNGSLNASVRNGCMVAGNFVLVDMVKCDFKFVCHTFLDCHIYPSPKMGCGKWCLATKHTFTSLSNFSVLALLVGKNIGFRFMKIRW
jgi:hypothetical protein